jgi:hypothetical protein
MSGGSSLGKSILDILLATGDEIDAEHEKQQKKIERLFKEYDINPNQHDAWESLARALAVRYVPGFSSARRQGRPKGQPDDLFLMMMIELLRRREHWSIPKACRAIADAHAIEKPANALRDRYKVLVNRDPRWKTLFDVWSIDFLETQVGRRLAGVEKN